jgi:diacylglycerol kinase (ATP)
MTENRDHKKNGSLARLKRAFVVSINGMQTAWKGEEAFRQEVCVAIVAVPVAFLLPISLTLQFILAGSLFLILAVELLNSAVEAAIDLVTEDEHPLAKNAKDMGSAAVLVCIILAVLVWSVVLIPLLIKFWA